MSENSKHIIDITGLNAILPKFFSVSPDKGVLQGVRKITKGQVGKRIVHFPSLKNKSMMPCESRLEADNCLELEFNTSVLKYRTQPFTIQISRKEHYTPDSIHVDETGNYVVREVKVFDKLSDEKLSDRLIRIKNIFNFEEIVFDVYTEKDLQNSPQLENRKFLYRNSRQVFDQFHFDQALGLLEGLQNRSTLRVFREKCNAIGLTHVIADKLLFLGYVKYDIKKLLTPDSLIWKYGEMI